MSSNSKKNSSDIEETVSLKSFLRGFQKPRPFASEKSFKRKDPSRLNSNFRTKQIDLDNVGEEGTAQIIRSPIVKRGKSSNQSLEISPSNPILNQSDFSQIQLKTIQQENKYLQQENLLLKTQIRVTHKSLNDTKEKLESCLANIERLKEYNSELLIENKKLYQEVDKLLTVINMYEGESRRSSHAFLQDDLEAKILSLDKEKEEKYELYRSTLLKLISYLNEFVASEEWTLSLISSPFVQSELKENEYNIRSRLERLQNEINFCQSQVKTERYNDKSYFTSISSSVIQSPMLSPKPTLRSGELTQLKYSNNVN